MQVIFVPARITLEKGPMFGAIIIVDEILSQSGRSAAGIARARMVSRVCSPRVSTENWSPEHANRYTALGGRLSLGHAGSHH